METHQAESEPAQAPSPGTPQASGHNQPRGGPLTRLKQRIRRWPPLRRLLLVSRRLILPGFQGQALFDVAAFFLRGLNNGRIITRASAVAFQFYLALFPALMFFLTLIPLVPVEGFQESLMVFLQEIMPESLFLLAESAIRDLLTVRRGGVLSLGAGLTLFFAAGGIQALMRSFNETIHSVEMRPWPRQLLVSLALVLILSFLVITAVTVQIGGSAGLRYLEAQGLWETGFTLLLAHTGRLFIVAILAFTAISLIYRLAPTRMTRIPFLSAGSTLATLLSLVTTAVFNFYIDNFSHYNIIYGSIGTFLVLLLWIYFLAFHLVIGFELNASIAEAGRITEPAEVE